MMGCNILCPKAQDFVCRALAVEPEKIERVELVKGGMTNHSYLLRCGGADYLLRVPGEGSNRLVCRPEEAAAYMAVRELGICDDLVRIDPATGLKLTRFWENARNCDPKNPADLKKCMDLLRRFHAMPLRVEHTFDLFARMEFYERLWDGAPSCYADYKKTKAAVLALRPLIAASPKKWTLTHIDAVPDNFVFFPGETGEQLRLIDWEYAGMQDAHVDIAMFAIYAGYDRAALDFLIDLYFEGRCAAAVRRKIYAYVAICGLLWSNWCEYKAQLGVHYGDYALRQYAYAAEYAALAAVWGGNAA